MTEDELDRGTFAVLLRRFVDYRIPRAQRILHRVDCGESLRDSDISFLKLVYNETRNNLYLFDQHPEFEPVQFKFIDLYAEIVRKGLANEQKHGEQISARRPVA